MLNQIQEFQDQLSIQLFWLVMVSNGLVRFGSLRFENRKQKNTTIVDQSIDFFPQHPTSWILRGRGSSRTFTWILTLWLSRVDATTCLLNLSFDGHEVFILYY